MSRQSLGQDLIAIDLLKEAIEAGRIRIVSATANDARACYHYVETATGASHRVTCSLPVAEFACEHIA